jgi:hypothetical protein
MANILVCEMQKAKRKPEIFQGFLKFFWKIRDYLLIYN